MTLLRTALHYAGATVLLLAATRLASAIGGKRVVRIERRGVDATRILGGSLLLRSVRVDRLVAVDGAPLREIYVERGDLVVPRGDRSDDALVADAERAAEQVYQRAEARAARGDRPDRIEAA